MGDISIIEKDLFMEEDGNHLKEKEITLHLYGMSNINDALNVCSSQLL